MKARPITFAIGQIFACLFAVEASGQNSCSTIENDIARLACFDKAFPKTVAPQLGIEDAYIAFRDLLRIDGPTYISSTMDDCQLQIDVVSDVQFDNAMGTFRYLGRSVAFNARDVEIEKSKPLLYARGVPVHLTVARDKWASYLSIWVDPNPAAGLPGVSENKYLMEHYRQNSGFFSHGWKSDRIVDINFIVAWEYEADRTEIMNSFWDFVTACQHDQ